MTLRQRKRGLAWAAAVVALGGVAGLLGGLMVPLRVAVPEPNGPSPETSPAPSPEETPEAAEAELPGPGLAALRRLCAMDLRRPLRDRSAVKPGSPNPSMTVRLVGTVHEPGHSMAVFQKQDGMIELCAEGQSVEDPGGAVTVTRVERDKVTVRYADESHALVLPPDGAKGGEP